MLILPGALYLNDWYTKTQLDGDILLSVSETGYSNDRLSLHWLHYFHKFSSQRQLGAYRLLLLDGYGLHCTKEFIDYCDENKIIPFCLPPHSTHLLQPLDVVVFQPLKHFHAEAVEQATRTGCSDFNKIEFLAAIDSIRVQAFKHSTILSVFRKCGLIPYSTSIILSKLQESTPPPTYHAYASTSPEHVQPQTPSRQRLSKFVPTSRTVHSLKQHADYLWQADPTSDNFCISLNFFLKGSLAQAHSGAQAQDDLQYTQAADIA